MSRNVKSSVILMMVLSLCVLALDACGKKAELPAIYDYGDMSEYLKLGNYKGIEYVAPDNQVSEQEIADYIDGAILESAETVQNTEGTVEEDSVINIDYSGSIDGVEFDGGSASDVELDIADNNYIDGFAEGIIGHKAGETFDINVTFPENYGNEELSGRDAVFSITVNYIIEQNMPEYNDEWVAANTEYSTTEEYEEAVRGELLAGKESGNAGTEIQEVFDTILAGSEVISYPEKEYNAKLDKFTSSYKQYAEANDEEFDEFLENEMGITEEEFNDIARQSVESRVKGEMVLIAIARQENIELSDTDYNEYLLGLLEEAGYTEDSYEEEKGYTIQEYAADNDLFTSYLYRRVMDKVMEYSVEKK